MSYNILALIEALMILVGGVWYSVVYPTALPPALVLNSGSVNRLVPGLHIKRLRPISETSNPFTTCCEPSHFLGML